jgi:hypothetical protein
MILKLLYLIIKNKIINLISFLRIMVIKKINNLATLKFYVQLDNGIIKLIKI